MKKHLPTFILISVFLIGLSLLLYPTVSDWWNSFHQSKIIANYDQYVSQMDNETYKNYLNKARAYNKALVRRKGKLFELSDEEIKEYNSMLDVFNSGMMGYIEIPALQTTLPVYHGTSDAVLSVGIGHIEGSSLPVGGKSTHCVLSGHRGLPSAKLFSNLDELVEGDIFILTVLDETLTYEVDQIRIVEPKDVRELAIKRDMDYCTLVTCTPYGVNTHRLLVRGRRIDNLNDGSARVTSDAMQIDSLLVAMFIAVPIIIVLLVVIVIKTHKKSYNKKDRS